jgi:hypothetical protein
MQVHRYLFFALANHTSGEVLLGMRVARELCARGATVVFLAPRAMAPILEGEPYPRRFLDDPRTALDAVAAVAREEHSQVLCLVDVATVFMALESLGLDERFAREQPLPMMALDAWDLGSNQVWDLGVGKWIHSPHSAAITRRLRPVPMLRPGIEGGYRALPEIRPLAREERHAVRAALGVPDQARLVFFPTSQWQHPDPRDLPYNRRLAETFPPLIAAHLDGLDVWLLHVGPRPIPALVERLGARHFHHAPVPPARFAELLGAADLLLGYNLAATTIGAAVRVRVPAMIGTCGHGGVDAEAIEASLGRPLEPEARAFAARVAPLHPFAAWPIGLCDVLGGLLADNPYAATFTRREVLEVAAFRATAAALLEDRAGSDEAQASYERVVAALPGAADVVERWWA